MYPCILNIVFHFSKKLCSLKFFWIFLKLFLFFWLFRNIFLFFILFFLFYFFWSIKIAFCLQNARAERGCDSNIFLTRDRWFSYGFTVRKSLCVTQWRSAHPPEGFAIGNCRAISYKVRKAASPEIVSPKKQLHSHSPQLHFNPGLLWKPSSCNPVVTLKTYLLYEFTFAALYSLK